MSCTFAILQDRGFIHITGSGTQDFLQGLITNDMSRLENRKALYGGLLTPQAKILFDFFVMRFDDGVLIDVRKDIVQDLEKRLTFYKLRAAVEISDVTDNFVVVTLWGDITSLPKSIVAYNDPRFSDLGMRCLVPAPEVESMIEGVACEQATPDAYHARRIVLGIPEGGLDYTFGDAFPHEACFDQLNGVDFKKGCYVGQEVVSRMHHRGTARKRFVCVEGATDLPVNGSEIKADNLVIGTLGSVSDRRGIALFRLDRVAHALSEGKAILAGDIPLKLIKPPWADFDVPES